MLAFWIERKNAIWQIKSQGLMQKNPTNRILLESKSPLQDLRVANGPNGSIWLIWTETIGKGSCIYASNFDGESISFRNLISKGLKASYSPSVAFDPLTNQIGVVWHSFHRGIYQIYWRFYSNKQWSDILQVSTGNIFNYCPSIAFDRKGEVWIAWNRNINKIDPKLARDIPTIHYESAGAYNRYICWYHRKRIIVKNLTHDKVYELGSELPMNVHWPKIIADNNRIWVFARREAPKTGARRYNVLIYVFLKNKWYGPRTLDREGSNGRNHRTDITIQKNEIGVVWEGNDRRKVARNMHIDDSWINTCKIKIESLLQEIDTKKVAEYLILEAEQLQAGIKSEGPTIIKEKQGRYHLFFGNTHIHTERSPCYSPGNQSIEFNYQHARDIMQNDFSVITDHAETLNAFDWRELHKISVIYNQSGFYVTFPGYEYAEHTKGHVHVINRVDHLPYYGSNNPDTDSMAKLWKKLNAEQSMCIPHHTVDRAFTFNWENQFSCKYCPVVEVYQDARGSCEYRDCPGTVGTGDPQTEEDGHYVQDALMQGYRFGMIASGDHFGIARAAVYAPELTRDAIFDALKKRRCYGTTGAKIYLYFTINDQIMGSEIEYTSDLTLELKVEGTANLQEVSIFRNDCVLFCFHPGKIDFQTVVKFEQKSKDCFYYIRVIQTDKEMAWSSPIWVSVNDKDKNEHLSRS